MCKPWFKRCVNHSFINRLSSRATISIVIFSSTYRRFAFATVLALSTMGAVGSLPALAQADHDSVRKEVQSGKLKPLADILAMVQQRHTGRVVDIDLEQGSDGRRWYEIKLLSGERTTIYIDAVTGQEIPKPGAGTTAYLPMSSVVRSVLASHPGTVLKVELEGGLGLPPHYEFKLLSKDGREQVLRVDATTGRTMTETPIAPDLAMRILPLDKVLLALESRYKARATESELKVKHKNKQRSYYEVDLLLSNGRSLEVRVDAVTGEVTAEDVLR